MKNFLAVFLSFTALTVFAAEKPLTTNFKVDPAASTIAWLGKKITGQHDGKISAKNGSISFIGDELTAGEVVVDMNTITCADIPATDEYNAKLVGHLKSPDFFDVAKFPESKIVIKSAKKTAKGYKIKGDLTMIGQTQPVEFEAVIKKTDSSVSLNSTLVLDRTKWGLKYGSSNFFKGLGDKAINNEFNLTVSLNATK